jgi:hypothetical protein
MLSAQTRLDDDRRFALLMLALSVLIFLAVYLREQT